jgi:hypothetical protein
MVNTLTSWQQLDQIIKRKYGGNKLTESNLLTHKHALFIELHEGELCGNWVFPSQQLAISAISDVKVRELFSNFDDAGYLISLHIRDGIGE